MTTGGVSSKLVYSGSKDEIFSELEPKFDRGGAVGDSGNNGGNVFMWVFFRRGEEQRFKGIN